MELVPPLELEREHSPLAAARLRRQLTRDEAARRAGLPLEQVEWLEEGRAYRFPSGDTAMLAAVVYATSLGIERREAKQLAGLPVSPRPLEWNPLSRVAVTAAFLALLAALGVALAVPHIGFGGGHGSSKGAATGSAAATGDGLPPTWKVTVDVLNGSGDINYTRQVADRIGAMAYRIRRVAKADRFDYPHTTVYFEPRGEAVARRLAGQLGVATAPLPGGKRPLHLVVVVGPPRITGN
jgi:transcriptional regulator with XRE-family HTH domain